MEEIQFLNYIMSLGALLVAALAAWNSFKSSDTFDWELKDIREQIRILKNTTNDNKKR